jgi:hypothetical protein
MTRAALTHLTVFAHHVIVFARGVDVFANYGTVICPSRRHVPLAGRCVCSP